MIRCSYNFAHGPASCRIEISGLVPKRRYACADCGQVERDQLTANGIPNSCFPFKQRLGQVKQLSAKSNPAAVGTFVDVGGRKLSNSKPTAAAVSRILA